MTKVEGLSGHFARHKLRIFRVSTTLIVNVAVLAANMASGIITARGLDPVGRGELLAISMWPQIIASAFTFGMPAALVYEVHQKAVTPGAVYAGATLMITATATAAAAAAAFVLPFLMGGKSAHLIHFAQAFLILTPIISVGLVSISLFQALEDFRTYNGLRMLSPFSVILFLLAVHMTVGLNPETAAYSYAASGIVLTITGVSLAVSRLGGLAAAATRLREAVRRLAIYGRSHAWADFMGAIEANLDKILLAALLPAVDLGLYAVAYGSSRAMLAAASAISAVDFPRAAGLARPDALRAMARGAVLTALVALPPLLIGILFAGPLLHLVYGASFVAAETLLRLLLLEAYILGIVFVLAHAFLAAGLPAITSRVQAFSTVASALAVLLGVSVGGATGAAIGLASVAAMKLALLSIAFLGQRSRLRAAVTPA